MKALAIALCLLLSATSAWSAIYQWTDGKGLVHYTDNVDRIPAKYQKKAREVTLDAPSTMKYEEPAAPAAAPAAAPVTGGAQERYCGRDGASWHRQFRSLRGERQQLSDSLPELEKELLVRYNRLQRSLWDYDTNPPKKGDTKAEEAAAAKRKKQTASGQYGRPSANRRDYQEALTKRDLAVIRINEIGTMLADLENEAGRCGVPFEFRK